MSGIDWRVGELPAALADFDDNTFHAAFLDGPYGLSDDPPFDLIMQWLAGEKVKHKPGFLGRDWDAFPPGPDFWREMNRVLRPGALVFSFAHSRTPGLAEMAIRAGGLRILPAFAWLHGESQALGADVGKLIDKAAGAEREVVALNPNRTGRRPHDSPALESPTLSDGHDLITAPATPLAQLFDGHHSRLRTNYEPILCAMKPIDGTYAENAARWGCAGFDAEAGRIPTVSAEDDAMLHAKHLEAAGNPLGKAFMQSGVRKGVRADGYSSQGRFPSSVLIEHAFDCQVGACVPGCPAAVLAEQGGSHRPGERPNRGATRRSLTGGEMGGFDGQGREVLDGGTTDRFYFQARPARKERSAGCEGLFWQRAPDHPDGWRIVTEEDPHALEKDGATPVRNPHPALKSLELTRYLAKLLRQPGEASIIVPFCGSGSEAIGAALAGWRHVVSIDGSQQWIRTGKLREAFWQARMESEDEAPVKRMLHLDDRQQSLFG